MQARSIAAGRGKWLCRCRAGVRAVLEQGPQAAIRTALLAVAVRCRFGLLIFSRVGKMRPMDPVIRSMFQPLVVTVVVAVVVASYRDGDLFRDQRRIEREMIAVAQQQLQGVLALRQLEQRLGLASTEVQMLLVVRDWLVGIDRFIHIDKQVKMTGVGEIKAGWSNSHVAQTEATPE